jgi:hypothetical protein
MPRFSDRPGIWERQLLWRVNNALFAEDTRHPDHAAVEAARARDTAAHEAFAQAFRALFDEAKALPPSVGSEVILALKERTDRLYEDSARLPGDPHEAQRALARLTTALMQAVRRGAGADPYAQAELDQEDAARAQHHELLRHPLIAALIAPEAPIAPEHLVPTLLSVEPDALRAALGLFDAAQCAALRDEARALIAARAAEGFDLPVARNRLALIEALADETDAADAHTRHALN